MIQILNTVIPVFIIIAVGLIIGKIKKGINLELIVNLIFYIASPSLVFSTLIKSNVKPNDFIIIVFSAAAITLMLGFLSYMLLKKTDRIGLCLPMSVGNTGYIGYPIVLLAWGVDGLSKAVIFDSTAFIILLTLGIFIVSKGNGSGRFKEILKAAPI